MLVCLSLSAVWAPSKIPICVLCLQEWTFKYLYFVNVFQRNVFQRYQLQYRWYVVENEGSCKNYGHGLATVVSMDCPLYLHGYVSTAFHKSALFSNHGSFGSSFHNLVVSIWNLPWTVSEILTDLPKFCILTTLLQMLSCGGKCLKN